MSEQKSTIRTSLLTVVAMFAFAANSVLCRLALVDGSIDAVSFTSVRLVAGAIALGLIVWYRGGTIAGVTTDWRTVLALFVYMIFFSFAYLSLAAGTGALLLFGAVQLTMFMVARREGEAFSVVSWVGFVVAFSGLIYLVLPGITAPDPFSALLMVVAGIAWGFYSLLGRNVVQPWLATAKNFAYSLPMVIGASLLFWQDFNMSSQGLILGIVSGAVTSGCGYVVWYAALSGLTATRAATVQLSVPIIAACAGMLLLSEPASIRLLLASTATIGGITIVLMQRARLA
ncbi:MAG TPA: DMT family transporter [Gammaproteobacteria bacterium]|nr:DMT family transporter [Gammaproteobacteria bacterium]HIL97688.1 DMT family transporter [Pseudomonadales bacterium]